MIVCASAGSILADGSLGSRTGYSMPADLCGAIARGQPGSLTMAAEELLEQALVASSAGLSLAIHSIGDRANRRFSTILSTVRRHESTRNFADSPQQLLSAAGVCATGSSTCSASPRTTFPKAGSIGGNCLCPARFMPRPTWEWSMRTGTRSSAVAPTAFRSVAGQRSPAGFRVGQSGRAICSADGCFTRGSRPRGC